MALPRRERRLLEAIDYEMSCSDPHLVWLFRRFSGLWAGEPLPAREQLRTRTRRFWGGLWEALGAGAWPVPPLPDPAVTDTDAGTGAERGTAAAAPEQAKRPPGWLGQRGRAGHRRSR